uniref:U1-type domain-containing protein n=1 Tax=Octopus bimaculoides TaxID=37653 RepID=A0A0L8G657_OCTBM
MKILKELMQPMLCKLCNVAMNAAIQSDQHYNGKNHAKKVRLFMLSGGTQLPATKNRPAVEYKPGQEILVLTNSGSINGEVSNTQG